MRSIVTEKVRAVCGNSAILKSVKSIEIHPFRKEDCTAIAEAHLNFLTTSFRGNAGIQLLRAYYEVISQEKGGIGFLASSDGQMVGFACGVWDRPLIRRLFLKHIDKLIIYGIVQILLVPQMIPSVIQRLLNSRTLNFTTIEGYELRPLVVLPRYRGQGIADQLILHLLEDAKKRGVRKVSLVVDVRNIAAQKLYTKVGFKFERQINNWGNSMRLLSYSCSNDSSQ